MSWLVEWIFEGLIEATAEAIHHRYGWGGCASLILSLVAVIGALLWWGGVFSSAA
ncbi:MULTISPECIES: hypothetical protein [Novosphingobium]|uniref:hypothetical protein n=1 Tax=Novosphingobium TaxID=165696 RepID=UPI0022F29FA1|nr:hypothetical protein [Novosphingobium resinovorum]GLK43718.1 hypothetical protein GCM10017612_16370 [Novosphingobium resinovorum]